VQGTSSSIRRQGRRCLLILATAHVIAAGLIVYLLGQVAGLAVQAHVPPVVRLALVGATAVAAIVLDLRAARRRSYSVGWNRQTPEALAHSGGAWWVTPLIWGADTGLIWTTYRVSSLSWVFLVLVLLGAAPPWAGLAYGLAFAVPLLVAASRPAADGEACDVSPGARTRPLLAQLAGVGLMAVFAAGLLWLAQIT
jgi:hypothetical protein